MKIGDLGGKEDDSAGKPLTAQVSRQPAVKSWAGAAACL